MIKRGAIIGAIVGIVVVGLRAWYAFLNFEPDPDRMLDFSLHGLFAGTPLVWVGIGLPFGSLIGIVTGIILNYLARHNLIQWSIVNIILGAVIGWIITLSLFKSGEYLVWGTHIRWGFILAIILTYSQAFIFLQIPGAIIGAIVALLLKTRWYLPVRD